MLATVVHAAALEAAAAAARGAAGRRRAEGIRLAIYRPSDHGTLARSPSPCVGCSAKCAHVPYFGAGALVVWAKLLGCHSWVMWVGAVPAAATAAMPSPGAAASEHGLPVAATSAAVEAAA